ncbi:MAG: signal peptidase II [Omnitrophica WOR_2 bacterium]
MKKYFRDYVFLGLIAGVIVVLDQWTKYLVRTTIPLGERWAPWPWLMDYVRIVHWSNTGAAFGMLQGFGIVFTVLAIIVSIVIIIYYPRIPSSEWPLRIALGLQLGGALGNLIDRLTQTYVTDFISVGNFAVFNIADASISVGVAVLIIGVWIKEKQQAQDIENPPAGPLPEEPKSE